MYSTAGDHIFRRLIQNVLPFCLQFVMKAESVLYSELVPVWAVFGQLLKVVLHVPEVQELVGMNSYVMSLHTGVSVVATGIHI